MTVKLAGRVPVRRFVERQLRPQADIRCVESNYYPVGSKGVAPFASTAMAGALTDQDIKLPAATSHAFT